MLYRGLCTTLITSRGDENVILDSDPNDGRMRSTACVDTAVVVRIESKITAPACSQARRDRENGPNLARKLAATPETAPTCSLRFAS